MPYDPDRHGPVRIVGPGFRERVYAVVRLVPQGRVTTYGDVGSALGSPTVARQVGYALAALDAAHDDVPWHRVVNAQGRISFRGDDERGAAQRRRLVREGVAFDAEERIVGFAALRFSYEGPLFTGDGEEDHRP
jgi:methylated-DNA-protein-cysteine methyltransferase related protein